jgi:hypothetical protein
MKKIITLVLAIMLLMTSVVAIAETKATPNFKTFAEMKVKFIEGNNSTVKRYEINLSKPVDKLWVLWAEKGAEPEELGVDENLQATALAASHKYMPGIKQTIGTSKSTVTKSEVVYKWYDVDPSEDVYDWKYLRTKVEDPKYPTNPVYFIDEVEKEEEWKLYPIYDAAKNKVVGYEIYVPGEDGYEWLDDVETLEEAKFIYENWFDGYTANVTEPKKVESKNKVLDKFGNFDHYEVIGFKEGSMKGVKTTTSVNKKLATNKATAYDSAFATLEGEWLVYRNRKGTIVGIELYEGQL